MIKKLFPVGLFLLIGFSLSAQDIDLDKMLDEEMEKKKKSQVELAAATFKSTRIINGHSVESTQKGILDFRIQHRFGTLNQGAYEFFGLDNASMRIGFDYGLTDRLSVGIGRSTFGKQFDGFAKYRILWQSTGKKNMPISLTWVSSLMLQSLRNPEDGIKRNFSDRVFYAHQAIVARKFSPAFSLQLMPTMVHYNIVPTATVPNDLFAIGSAARVKLTNSIALMGEYYYQLPNNKLPGTTNSLALGVDIETGGHVFQLQFTNSTGMTERTFITETTGKWGDGDIHFGFNISRVFTIKKTKELPQQ